MNPDDYGLVADWRAFVYSGFQPDKLTRRLYQYLDQYHNPEECPCDDQATFWTTWFQNLYNLYTFLGDFYEAVPSSDMHQVLQRVLDPVFAEIIAGLNAYEMQIYTEIRDDEVAINLEEACRMNPDSTVAQVRADLCCYFDETMYEWFYSDYYCELEVTDDVLRSLAQRMNGMPDMACQASVFDLRQWLDDWPYDIAVDTNQVALRQTDLFTQLDQAVSVPELDLGASPMSMAQVSGSTDVETQDVITEDDEPHFDLEKIKARLAASPEEEAAMAIDPRIRDFQPAIVVATLT